ncbi:helix-turn-helix transcriptional regulator [Amycolatopsis keratiniphila]|uniref:helix-turn-helix domain-containing protein n=1 Tax=Amycolatopsis keratiniphila TaxID=129921 RepID=UPI0033E0CFA9
MTQEESAASFLRKLRRDQGRSLRMASTELGLAASQLSRLETGQRRFTPGMAKRVADYYGISSELIELADGRVPSDIVRILQRNPDELQRLREKYSLADEEGE